MSYALKKQTLSSADDTNTLVHAHLPLVRRLAWHVHGRVSSSEALEELIQAGMVALVEAARAFEDRGFEFSTYASVRIKGAMIDHLRRNAGQSRGAAATRRALEAARRTVENGKIASATDAEIAEQLGVPLPTYYRMAIEAQTGAHEPLDAIDTESDLTFSDPDELAPDLLDRESQEKRLAAAIGALDERSQMVLQLYFHEEMNLEEIGLTLNVGAARVCQIKKAALEKLRQSPQLAA